MPASSLTHLVCSACEKVHDKDLLWNLCAQCGKPLLARYDLASVRAAFTRQSVAGRAPVIWRLARGSRPCCPPRGWASATA